MTIESTPEEIAFRADLDRLRAQIGGAALEEASRRQIGEQMLNEALLKTLEANDPSLSRRDASVELWSEKPRPGWEMPGDGAGEVGK